MRRFPESCAFDGSVRVTNKVLDQFVLRRTVSGFIYWLAVLFEERLRDVPVGRYPGGAFILRKLRGRILVIAREVQPDPLESLFLSVETEFAQTLWGSPGTPLKVAAPL